MLTATPVAERPADLPEYEDPPVHEVVFDVQFDPIPKYSIATAVNILNMFKDEDQNITHSHALPPNREIFDVPFSLQPEFSMLLQESPPDLRLLSRKDDGTQVIQTQRDRFILNWKKKRADATYIRFNTISGDFFALLNKLQAFVQNDMQVDAGLSINQAELKYINFIEMQDNQQATDWIKISEEFKHNSEAFSFNSIETVRSEKKEQQGQPFARFYTDISMGVAKKSPDEFVNLIQLTFTFRGPVHEGEDIGEFFSEGRRKIVSNFDAMTTERAHEAWGKKRSKT